MTISQIFARQRIDNGGILRPESTSDFQSRFLMINDFVFFCHLEDSLVRVDFCLDR